MSRLHASWFNSHLLRLPLLLLLFLVALLSSNSFGQGIGPGIPPFSSWVGEVNVSNLNILVDIPVRTKPGAIPFAFHISENNGFTGSTLLTPRFLKTSVVDRDFGHTSIRETCPDGKTITYVEEAWILNDFYGTVHPFPGSIIVDTQGCLYGTTANGLATDNSGYNLFVDLINGSYVTDLAGNKWSGAYTDTNANSISVTTTNGQQYYYMDTLGQTAITRTLTNGAGSPDQYSYTDASGTTRTVQVNYSPVIQETAFGGTCISYGPTNTYFPTSISLPDGSSAYTFTYEHTTGHTSDNYYTGRIASIQLPTGALLQYQYSGGTNGINCSDLTGATITKTTPDGTWTYVHTPPSGSSVISTTKVTDPAGNETDYTFSNGVETQRISYQGLSGGNNILSTKVTCYTSTLTNCSTATVGFPITFRAVLTTPKGMTSSSEEAITYDSNSQPTDVKVYDFGASTYTYDTATVYGTWNGSTCARLQCRHR